MVQNLDKWKRRFAAIPPAVKKAAKEQLAANATELVEAMKRAAPVDKEGDASAGRYRDSIRWEENPRKELGVTIIADAKDEDGHGFAPHLEFGHRSPDGSHVPANPSFFPTYRAQKKAMKRKLSAATRKAIKAEAEKS